MYPRRSQGWILSNHPEDQIPNLLRRPSSPTCVRTLEISRQYIRKPVRCQRTTVTGVTTRACFHSDSKRRTTTQKSISKKPRLGRGCRRFNTARCFRSTRFSKTSFPWLRKTRIRARIQRKNRLNMARSYTKSTIGGLVVSCWFCVRRELWRRTGLEFWRTTGSMLVAAGRIMSWYIVDRMDAGARKAIAHP
jgi:hypothetical protein